MTLNQQFSLYIKTVTTNQGVLISVFFIFMFFLIKPVLLLFLLLFSLFFFASKDVRCISNLLVCFSSAIIALIHSLRLPYTDLLFYVNIYNQYGSMSWLNVAAEIKVDFIFYYISKIIYHLSAGSERVFVFFWCFIIYYLLSKSILLFYKNKVINKESFILGLFVLYFSTTFLSLASHLMRQLIAGSFFVFYLSNLYFGYKKKYLLALMAGIHFSSLIILLYPVIKNKKIFFGIISFVVFILFTGLNPLKLIFSSIPVFNISNLDFLMSHINGAINKVKDDGSVPLATYFVSIVLLSFLFYFSIVKKQKNMLEIFYAFTFSFLLFNLFMPIQLLWLRFSFYQYPFYFVIFPFVFTFFMKKVKMTAIFYWIVSVLYFINFYLYFDKVAWVHKSTFVNVVEFSLFDFISII